MAKPGTATGGCPRSRAFRDAARPLARSQDVELNVPAYAQSTRPNSTRYQRAPTFVTVAFKQNVMPVDIALSATTVRVRETCARVVLCICLY